MDFPRGLIDSQGDPVLPMGVSWPVSSGPLVDQGATGRDQARGVAGAGFTWTERYGPLPLDRVTRGFFAQLRLWRANYTILDVDHPRVVQLGAGGGTPLVAGAGQTGAQLLTDGWPATTEILYAGDFIRTTVLLRAFEVTADVVSDGAGGATIPITPSIFVGGEPTDNDAVSIAAAGVAFFKARIANLVMPTYNRDQQGLLYAGLQVTFREAV